MHEPTEQDMALYENEFVKLVWPLMPNDGWSIEKASSHDDQRRATDFIATKGAQKLRLGVRVQHTNSSYETFTVRVWRRSSPDQISELHKIANGGGPDRHVQAYVTADGTVHDAASVTRQAIIDAILSGGWQTEWNLREQNRAVLFAVFRWCDLQLAWRYTAPLTTRLVA